LAISCNARCVLRNSPSKISGSGFFRFPLDPFTSFLAFNPYGHVF
jgi:hypothetical protein